MTKIETDLSLITFHLSAFHLGPNYHLEGFYKTQRLIRLRGRDQTDQESISFVLWRLGKFPAEIRPWWAKNRCAKSSHVEDWTGCLAFLELSRFWGKRLVAINFFLIGEQRMVLPGLGVGRIAQRIAFLLLAQWPQVWFSELHNFWCSQSLSTAHWPESGQSKAY